MAGLPNFTPRSIGCGGDGGDVDIRLAHCVWVAPSNVAANRAWLAIERGTATETSLLGLPPEVAAAGRVLLAWQALRSGQVEEGRGLLSRASSPQFAPIGLADLAILDEAAARRAGR